jgi:hypothetical protein
MTLYPELPELLTFIECEVERHGGTVSDRFHNGEYLFLRALLPVGGEVRRRDFIGHGLAVRTRDRRVVVHPYTFRQLCSNGAIHITHISSRSVERGGSEWEGVGVVTRLRQAIQACSVPAVFDANLDDMQRMLAAEVHRPLVMSHFMRRLGDAGLVTQIMSRYLAEDDHSLFGLMNAVTAQARDEPEPERRWNLEELGGGMIALLRPPQPVRTPGRKRSLPTSPPRIKAPTTKVG